MAPALISEQFAAEDYSPGFSTGDCPTLKQHLNFCAKTHKGESQNPPSWPKRLSHPLCWNETDFKTTAQFIYTLSQAEVDEIERALAYFQTLELHGSEIQSSNFPLPNLQHVLKSHATELYEGRGFFVLRGLNPKKYTAANNILIYLGISTYVGSQRKRQDPMGNMLAHIFNDTLMDTPMLDRGAKASNMASKFHADACEILALQTLSPAAKGGKTLLSSSWTIYNELASTRPDLIHLLSREDWTRHDFGLSRPSCRCSLMYYHDEKIILNFSRPALLGLNSPERQIPRVQLEVIETIQAIAQKHQLAIATEPGDLMFINNFAILHGREAFEDDGNTKRHLVRLWLSNPTQGWRTPPEAHVWLKALEKYDTEDQWEIEPVPRRQYRSYWFSPH